MQTVTSFGEVDSEEDSTLLEEYGQIFQALSHDQKVAENVFARVAKKALKRRLGETKLLESKNARGLVPTWVSESSVVVIMPAAGVKPNSWFESLDSLVEGVAYSVQESVNDRDFALIDPLSTRIQHVGENLYKFTLKQKWALVIADG